MRHARSLLCSLGLLSLVLPGCRRAEPPAVNVVEAAPAPAAPTPVEVKGRRVDIRATEHGYEPSTVAVKAGEEVTLVFTLEVPSHCLSEITIPSLKIRKLLPLHQPIAIPLRPERSGDIPFACGMDMVHGLVHVE